MGWPILGVLICEEQFYLLLATFALSRILSFGVVGADYLVGERRKMGKSCCPLESLTATSRRRGTGRSI